MSGKFGEPEYPNLEALANLMSQQSGGSTVPTTNPPAGRPSPFEGLYGAALRGLSGSIAGNQTVPSAIPSFSAFAATQGSPHQPSMTSLAEMRAAEARFEKNLLKIQDILPIGRGRVVPDDDDLMIGDARRLKLAVLFIDICGFSQIPSFDDDEQDRVLMVLNLFMAEMLQVVKKLGGDFEKNTGDGLMVYFKSGAEEESARTAIDAAVTMHFFNDQVISPRLKNLGLPEIKFRVGIEAGVVTIANVGIRGPHHSLVAIGDTANVACKLMSLLPNGGIVLGEHTCGLLPDEWRRETALLGTLPGFVFRGTQIPYRAHELKYRAPRPFDWSFLPESLGGR